MTCSGSVDFFLLMVFCVLLKFILWGIKTSKRLYALKKLKQINNENPIVFAIGVSELLRRIDNKNSSNVILFLFYISRFYIINWFD